MASALPTSADTALLALRPVLPTTLAVAPEPTAGDFLHRTLRPVLKLQNELLLALVADFLREHHVAFQARNEAEQLRTVTELLSRNVKLRYTIIGVIIGLFTSSEQEFYRQHRSELNRRLLELATQRVSSQLPALTAQLTGAA
ncbi:hypothetical protein [Hymenobacter chitinivorans]|uniref:Glyoxalase n=1 Tax=Hymenobacter chitinivorans DSM 11115 TaxID=1121954 RepID=A0A2M9B954_9BACT|nr:hypothetical protein [Hymenobacter chitinivorans]PJJ54486.1 hypothetical protein CLV45_2824 [Hymenobacter chitinivorans DSM 11115]